MTEKWPQRKTPPHFPVIRAFNRSAIVLLTVCAEKRKPVLACEPAHELLIDAWREADFWCVGRYTVMPDHIHLFCAPGTLDEPPLENWVDYWKTIVSRSWPWPRQHPIWQKSCWDRQLRSGESYAAKWHYVRYNPVRAGLVSEPEDWPYQGELNVLEWHD